MTASPRDPTEPTRASSPKRPFVTPEPGEDWAALAARALPGQPVESAVQSLRSWNMHLFVRMPSGVLLGSDVVFTGPSLSPDHSLFGSVESSAFGGGSAA
jgi:hypothetical protein